MANYWHLRFYFSSSGLRLAFSLKYLKLQAVFKEYQRGFILCLGFSFDLQWRKVLFKDKIIWNVLYRIELSSHMKLETVTGWHRLWGNSRCLTPLKTLYLNKSSLTQTLRIAVKCWHTTSFDNFKKIKSKG